MPYKYVISENQTELGGGDTFTIHRPSHRHSFPSHKSKNKQVKGKWTEKTSIRCEREEPLTHYRNNWMKSICGNMRGKRRRKRERVWRCVNRVCQSARCAHSLVVRPRWMPWGWNRLLTRACMLAHWPLPPPQMDRWNLVLPRGCSKWQQWVAKICRKSYLFSSRFAQRLYLNWI